MTAAQDHPYGFSPNSSASAEFDDPLERFGFDEDDLGYGEDDDQSTLGDLAGSTGPTRAKRSNNRKGPHNVEKRNLHNATERARRDNLNTRFMDLARSLPTMTNIKRPSKAVIVAKALDFVFDSQHREHALVEENNALRREVDALRARLGMAPLPPPAPLPDHKVATQATMRKPKKATESAPKVISAPAEVVPKIESPALQHPHPSPSTTHVASPASYTHPSPSSSAASASPSFDAPVGYPSLFPTASSASLDAAPLSSSPVDSSTAYPPVSLPPNPFFASAAVPPASAAAAGVNPYAAAMLNPSAAAALLHGQQVAQAAHLAGLLAPSASQGPYAAAAAAYLNPQLLFALQQQQQQQAVAPSQAMPQQVFGAGAEAWMTPPSTAGGMFATMPGQQTVDGLGF
ncbi:hypothetical protein JCM10207_001387 [Rhodosporidiobolus poonsookiae]